MDIGYSTLERLLVALFGLSESQREPLVGRFKYLQRLGGFGERVAKGRARYQIEHILRVVLTFELIDVGCKPTRAWRMVRTHWQNLRLNLGYAWRDARAYEAGERLEPLFWMIVPHALGELGAADGMADVDVSDHAGEMDPQKLLTWRGGAALQSDRHAIFINLPQLLAACREAIAIIDPRQQEGFCAALDDFAAAELAVLAK